MIVCRKAYLRELLQIETDSQQEFRESSLGIVSVLAGYRVSVSPALVQQLQLWHWNWLRPVHSVRDLHAYLKETLLLLSKHIMSFMTLDIMCCQFPCISTSSTIVGTGGSENVVCVNVCVCECVCV